ncbi:unnamed protein product [Sympodiomycopsis kandeliae]
MTASGSSAADALHQLYDAAAQTIGLGGEEDAQEQSSQEQSQEQGQQQQQQQQQQSEQSQSQSQSESQKESQDPKGWLETLGIPRWNGPGNHPNDPANPQNQEYYHDTVGKNTRSSELQNEHSDKRVDEQDAQVDDQETTRKSKEPDALERALSKRPAPNGHRDDEYDDQHRQEDPRSTKTSRGAFHSTNAVDEEVYSDRNDKNARAKHPEAYPAKPQHEEHPAHRGPMWASRPDDAQRAKIREMKRRRHQAFKEENRRNAEGDSGEDVANESNASQPQQQQQQQNGDADATQSTSKGSSRPNTAPRPSKDRAGSSRLASFLTGSNRRKSNSFRQPSGDDADPSSSSGPSESQQKRQDGSGSNNASNDSSGGLRGVFGAAGNFSDEPQPAQDPYTDNKPTGSKPAPADHDGKQQRKDTYGSADSRPAQQADAPDAKPASQRQSSQDAQMSKISNLMLGRKQASADDSKDGKMATETAKQDGDTDGAQTGQGSGLSSSQRWALLKQRVQATGAVAKHRANKQKEGQRKRVLGGLDMTAELQSGILPVFLLKMALERDEAGHRRVPVLLNHLRLKVTDSVNPLHNTQAIFRIELSYGDDMIKWVIYRTLGDFIALHTHYRAAALRGYLGRAVGDSGTADGEIGLPRFPKTSLPYFRQLQSQGKMKGEEGKKEFSRIQREALEEYIIALIRRTMFRPEANRLCKFFELSALGISLATRGGFCGKQGFLRVLSRGGRKAEQTALLSPGRLIKSRDPKWFVVRESYIVISPGPETLEVHDVFLIDGEFRVERPKRLYKQAAHLASELKGGDDSDSSSDEEDDDPSTKIGNQKRSDDTALLTDGQFKKSKEDKKKNKSSTATKGDQSQEVEKAGKAREKARRAKNAANTNVSSHVFYLYNAERKLKLSAKSDRILEQFVASIERVAMQSPFSGSNRFGSFAPIRLNVNAQWLVDGRDYFWEVSRALLLAKDRIMIHDWWLSPELYLRRPGSPKWRLDNILQKKAQEGVKIFVILYNEVSNNFTPTDSGYTKSRLTSLHPNIYVQRSPSHFQTGTFYWAHHEKMCAIDETIAFMGGLDLCFGRYDTPAHVLVDDVEQDYQSGNQRHRKLLGPATAEGKEAHIWPGQDYANERVAEWSDLTKPAEDLFDRTRFPRMPWHDTGLQLIGQPARDLCRHFTQRWNYLLRNKNHKRKFPFLVPAPDFTAKELKDYKLTGTCETQICRSAGPWSLGTSKTVEHSIQNAYLKCIQMSDHFVYIENQFFVTSTVVEGTMIENNIGNALVSRIIRAHREGTPWRAVIVIPLIPGFPMPISEPDASSVRIICDCQYRSICRGEHSIFGKLRREGIDPDEYIGFFSLRNWGKLRGGQLTTEQVYIHGKCAMFDDRIAIIGSANINERSQRGDRDSELACVIRDTDMIDSTMAGQPYKVGRFAHTLRIHLMREHLGVDVDEVEQREAKEFQEQEAPADKKSKSGEDELSELDDERPKDDAEDSEGNVTRVTDHHRFKELGSQASSTARDAAKGLRHEVKDFVSNPSDSVPGSNPTKKVQEAVVPENGGHEDDELGDARADEEKRQDNVTRLLQKDAGAERPEDSAGVGTSDEPSREDESQRQQEDLSTTVEERRLAEMHEHGGRSRRAVSEEPEGQLANQHQRGQNPHRMDESASAPILGGGSQEEGRKKINAQMSANPWAPPISVPKIDPESFKDPLSDAFYKDMWLASAIHNTQIYRKVFRCVPDDSVTNWPEYKAFMAWSDRLAKSGRFAGKENKDVRNDIPPEARGPGAHFNKGAGAQRASAEGDPVSKASSPGEQGSHGGNDAGQSGATNEKSDADGSSNKGSQQQQYNGAHPNNPASGSVGTDGGFSNRELEQMEALLQETVGTVVIFPTRFLETEDRANNFLFPMDRINPLNVYD